MLKFNIKEHELKELEKYDFDYYKNEMFNKPYYTNGYVHIWCDTLNVDIYFLNSTTSKAPEQLYDLIKDGLIIKEKDNDNK